MRQGGMPGGPGRRPPRPLTPRSAFRIAVLGAIALALIGVLVVRLWFLQVIGNQAYAQRAEDNRVRTVADEAPRGLITDRTGRVVLAQNRPSRNVVAYPQELRDERRLQIMRRLAPILGVGPAVLMRRMAEGEEAAPYQPVVLAENIARGVEWTLAERIREFPGVEIDDAFVRDYPEDDLAAHVLGYTRQITAEQYDTYRARGYVGNERIGQDGVERQYEQYLRGVAGERQVEVDAFGEPVAGRQVVSRPPVQGDNLALTIDVAAQRALQAQLRQRVDNSFTAEGAAGVALDPRTGEIIALASYPTFRPNVFVQPSRRNNREITGYFREGANDPMNNRAVQGRFPPASTFKAVTAGSAMRLGILSPTELIGSPSEIELYGTVFPNFQKEFHGNLALPQALEFSSDTYFYSVGSRFWERRREQQQAWARRWGFGALTRIDLPGETGGRVPSPEWKREYFRTVDPTQVDWVPGDDINMTVGQGNLEVTPLQMAVAYAAIANGGRILTPTLGRQVTTQSGRLVRRIAAARPERRLGIPESMLGPIREGLYLAANGGNGTARAIFAPVAAAGGPTVAGKTGTAEPGIRGEEDHSWFVGYAPYNDPRIVVAIVVEHGGTGASAAAPAVCNVIAAYTPTRFDPSLCGTPPARESN
jgi:penicillin-binding protein 2